MYPFVNFKYKSSQDQSVYRYQRIEVIPPTITHFPHSPARFEDFSLNIDWLDGNSSLYDTVKASDAVADEYSLNDSSVLANFLNLSDDNVLDNYNLNEFIDTICNERCDDEAAEQYILTELLQPPVAELKTPPRSLQIPPTPPQTQSSHTSTTTVSVKPKLTKCLQFISNLQSSSVATATPYHKKSSKRPKKKCKRPRDHSITTNANGTTIPEIENTLKVEPNVLPPSDRDSAVRNLLHNRKNYRPLDWINSLQTITSKNNKPVSPTKETITKKTDTKETDTIETLTKKTVKKETIKREVKVKKEVLDVSLLAHYEANDGDKPFMGFMKRSLYGHSKQLNKLKKLANKLNAVK